MRDLGRERYRQRVSRARAGKVETTTVAGRYLLREAVARVHTALEDWIERAHSHISGGVAFSSLPYVKRVKPEVIALVAVKCLLDQIARQRNYVTTALAIASGLEDEDRINVFSEAQRGPLQDLLNRYLKNGKRQTRLIIRRKMRELKVDFEPWPSRIKVRLGSMLIEMVRLETGLIDVIPFTGSNKRTSLLIVPNAEALAWLEKSHAEHEVLFPFYLPTKIPPADWEGLRDGGYHSDIIVKRPLVKTIDNQALLELEQAEMAEVYSAVNTLQRTAWEIHPGVYSVLRGLWESDLDVADLPFRDDEPLPPLPDHYRERFYEQDCKIWRRCARVIHERNRAMRSRRLMTTKLLFVAKELSGAPFYFPMQLDFRGRIYPVPFFLQPQGPSQARGLLRFVHGKSMENEEAVWWWKIHGANCYGLDKVPFEQRLDWVSASEQEILASGTDPLSNLWWSEADKPWEFLAWCLEYAEWRSNPHFTSHIAVQMDGSNNGLQIFSLLLRDEVGGRATNCTNTDWPQDIYQEVADLVTEKLEARTAEEPFARDWLRFVDGRLPRAAVKRPVMVLPYGGTRQSCHQYVMDWFADECRRGKTTPWLADFYTPCYRLSQLIWDAIGEVVVAARAAMKWLQDVARVCTQQGQPVQWTTPVGFKVRQAYTDYRRQQISTGYGDAVRRVRLREAGERLCSRSQRNGIAPNYVHSLDAAALVRTVNLCAERGIENYMMIHDSYGCLAADAPLMAQTLRRAYVELFSEDQLSVFRSQIAAYLSDPGALPPLPAKGSLDINELTSSTYFFA